MRSSKDATAHSKLKYRSDLKGAEVEDSLRRLREAEEAAVKDKVVGRRGVNKDIAAPVLKITGGVEVDLDKYGDADSDEGGEGSDDDDDDPSDDDDSDSEDEDELLAREMEKIRAERAAAKRRQEELEAEAEEEAKAKVAMTGNPLLNGGGAGSSGKMKRKWNDDVVFRNQAKTEKKTEKRFINDTVRNDFHKRFMSKYMK